MEKRVKVLHSESEGSWLKPMILVTLESNKYQMRYLIGLVTLLLNIGPKLAFVCCLIIVFILLLGV